MGRGRGQGGEEACERASVLVVGSRCIRALRACGYWYCQVGGREPCLPGRPGERRGLGADGCVGVRGRPAVDERFDDERMRLQLELPHFGNWLA